ncbi:MAG: methyltransferase domain-containing protein [Rhodocyclales bacterium]|nr:methyltransferase domain-containing protein [Rhodocyclales bacterium]
MPLGWAAPVYDWYCPKLGLGPAFRAKTIALGELKPGMQVLEVGCGTGVLTRLAAAAVGPDGRAVGIDPAPEMIAVARQKAVAGAQFRLGVIEALPFADASFDVVFASAMLHHLPPATKDAGLKEVFRVLRPGGRLVVVDLDRPANPLWWLLFFPLLAWPMTAGNLRGEIPDFLARAGFAPVARHGRWLGLLSFWTTHKGGAS